MSKRSTLRRRVSTNISNQCSEQTCYAHTIAKMMSRFVLVTCEKIFDTYENDENDENCDKLFTPTLCPVILRCIADADVNCTPQNIVLALLYRIFYRILTKNCNGNIFLVVLIFQYCSDLTYKKFMDFWKNPDELFEDVIESQESVQLYSTYKDYLMTVFLSLIHIKKMVNANKIVTIKISLDDLKLYNFRVYYTRLLIWVLSLGFYASISCRNDTDSNHAMTIVDFDRNAFIIKNSWGRENNSFLPIMENGKIELGAFGIFDNEPSEYLNYVAFVITRDDMDKFSRGNIHPIMRNATSASTNKVGGKSKKQKYV